MQLAQEGGKGSIELSPADKDHLDRPQQSKRFVVKRFLFGVDAISNLL